MDFARLHTFGDKGIAKGFHHRNRAAHIDVLTGWVAAGCNHLVSAQAPITGGVADVVTLLPQWNQTRAENLWRAFFRSYNSEGCNGFLQVGKDFEELRKTRLIERLGNILLWVQKLDVFLHAALAGSIH